MRKTVCFYQAFRRKKFIGKGVGDCEICAADEKNKNCAEFLPITLWTFEAKLGAEAPLMREQ